MPTSVWPLIVEDGGRSSVALPIPGRARVLVVDADNLFRHTVVQALTDDHFLVTSVGDAEHAIQLLERQEFDVVLLAEYLPGISGTDLARTIRAWPAKRDVALVALTIDSSLTTAMGLLEAGCDAFLAKPIGAVELREAVRELARSRSPLAV
jgi:DNA-binding response OmpR family regulator